MVTFAGISQADVEERSYAQFPRLSERRNQLAGTMSGGEQQMLAMARGLAAEPSLLFLDELSMGLAPLIVEELYAIVSEIARTGVSILVVEQFARTVLGVADYAAIMLNGQISTVGQPVDVAAELRSEERTSELQSLMRISYAVFCLKKKKITHTLSKT